MTMGRPKKPHRHGAAQRHGECSYQQGFWVEFNHGVSVWGGEGQWCSVEEIKQQETD